MHITITHITYISVNLGAWGEASMWVLIVALFIIKTGRNRDFLSDQINYSATEENIQQWKEMSYHAMERHEWILSAYC